MKSSLEFSVRLQVFQIVAGSGINNSGLRSDFYIRLLPFVEVFAGKRKQAVILKRNFVELVKLTKENRPKEVIHGNGFKVYCVL